MFFPLDENTEEAGVAEVTDLSKNVAKPVQNSNVTLQNKAFTYDVLKTRLSVLLPYHVQWLPLKSLSSVALPQNQEGYKHPETKEEEKQMFPILQYAVHCACPSPCLRKLSPSFLILQFHICSPSPHLLARAGVRFILLNFSHLHQLLH